MAMVTIKILKPVKDLEADALLEPGQTTEWEAGRINKFFKKHGVGHIELSEEVVNVDDDNDKLTSKNTNDEIKAYLTAHEIEFPEKATKAELLALVPEEDKA